MSCSWLYHDPLLHVFLGIMTCMHLFFFVLFYDTTFCVLVFVFHTHLVLFVCSPLLWLDALPVCVCVVTSCPVLEFELRKAKETIQALRTNLTQAAGVATFLLFLHLKPFVLQPSPSHVFGFLSEFLRMINAKHLSRLIFLLTFSESEILSQERKNYKSSPEIQVGKPEVLQRVQSVAEGLDTFLMVKLDLVPSLQEPIRPLEKRALNFLVNEYLLKNEYKLSSITFSDENDDQVKKAWCCHTLKTKSSYCS